MLSNEAPQLSWRSADGLHRLPVASRVYIGRHCRGVPAGQCIVIDDPNVSRDHAVVTYDGALLTVRDTSRNGTRVNGRRVTAGVDHPLHDGDQLQVGPVEIQVDASTVATAAATSTSSETRVIATRQILTHVVVDVRGFSTLAQELDSPVLYDALQRLFPLFTQAVHHNGGTVKDFAGDAVYAFWEHGATADAHQAVKACRATLVQLRSAIQCISSLRESTPQLAEMAFGWGIATGESTLSHYGVRSDNVAVVGDSTNLAFRLCALANKDVPTPIVLCSRTAQLVGDVLPVRELAQVSTKGRSGLETVYGVEELSS